MLSGQTGPNERRKERRKETRKVNLFSFHLYTLFAFWDLMHISLHPGISFHRGHFLWKYFKAGTTCRVMKTFCLLACDHTVGCKGPIISPSRWIKPTSTSWACVRLEESFDPLRKEHIWKRIQAKPLDPALLWICDFFLQAELNWTFTLFCLTVCLSGCCNIPFQFC